jgi:HK97 gp10 family phage protein
VKTTARLVGFKELASALEAELPKATRKNITRRAAIDALKPLEQRAKALAPKDDGALANSITTKPAKAKRVSRTRYASTSGSISVMTGPTSGRGADSAGGNAAWQEFGTVKMPANPYMRPAADTEGQDTVDRLGEALAVQIDKAKARIARKAARAKG